MLRYGVSHQKHCIALPCVTVTNSQNVANATSLQYGHKTKFVSPAWLTSLAIHDSLLFWVMSSSHKFAWPKQHQAGVFEALLHIHQAMHGCYTYYSVAAVSTSATLPVSSDSACRVTWHFPAAGFTGILAMSGLTSLIWQRSSGSNLCDQIAPGTDQV